MRRRSRTAACPGRRRAVFRDYAGSRDEREAGHPSRVCGSNRALVGPAAARRQPATLPRRSALYVVRRGGVPPGSALRDAALLDAAAARAARGIALQDGTKPSVTKIATGVGDAVELRWTTGRLFNATRFLLGPGGYCEVTILGARADSDVASYSRVGADAALMARTCDGAVGYAAGGTSSREVHGFAVLPRQAHHLVRPRRRAAIRRQASHFATSRPEMDGRSHRRSDRRCRSSPRARSAAARTIRPSPAGGRGERAAATSRSSRRRCAGSGQGRRWCRIDTARRRGSSVEPRAHDTRRAAVPSSTTGLVAAASS